MRLAVEELDAHVDDRMPLRAAGGERIARALLDGRDVRARHRAADDRVDELEAAPRRQRRDPQLHHRELAVAARLLLQLALDLRVAGDGLAVGHGRGRRRDVHAEDAGETLDATATCVSPRPRSTVWPPVRSMTRVGSSATRRVSEVISFSSSDCVAGARLTANTGSRRRQRDRTGGAVRSASRAASPRATP